MSQSSMTFEGMTGSGGRATSEYGLALVYQPRRSGHVSFQAFGGGFQLGEGGLDATDVLTRLSDGFRGLGDQLGDPNGLAR